MKLYKVNFLKAIDKNDKNTKKVYYFKASLNCLY